MIDNHNDYNYENDFGFTTNFTVGDYINTEVQDGTPFEEILAKFNLRPGEVFEFLLYAGKLDESILDQMLNDH